MYTSNISSFSTVFLFSISWKRQERIFTCPKDWLHTHVMTHALVMLTGILSHIDCQLITVWSAHNTHYQYWNEVIAGKSMFVARPGSWHGHLGASWHRESHPRRASFCWLTTVISTRGLQAPCYNILVYYEELTRKLVSLCTRKSIPTYR